MSLRKKRIVHLDVIVREMIGQGQRIEREVEVRSENPEAQDMMVGSRALMIEVKSDMQTEMTEIIEDQEDRIMIPTIERLARTAPNQSLSR